MVRRLAVKRPFTIYAARSRDKNINNPSNKEDRLMNKGERIVASFTKEEITPTRGELNTASHLKNQVCSSERIKPNYVDYSQSSDIRGTEVSTSLPSTQMLAKVLQSVAEKKKDKQDELYCIAKLVNNQMKNYSIIPAAHNIDLSMKKDFIT